MTTAQFPPQGFIFWPVGTGDSTTIVIDDGHVVQVDLHHMTKASDDDAVVSDVVDQLVAELPKSEDGRPYLSAFILTHADLDHCLGFEDLLDKVLIGELWATPRLWREYTENEVALCPDAEAFHKEAKRRVEATMKAVEAGRQPSAGDRIRVVGYDTENSTHAYSELPDEYLSTPGDAVTMVDGEDLSDRFEAFIHAPFKDDCAAERNDTSLALQVTLKSDDAEGHALLLGDLAHETIMKVFTYSENHGRPERLAWEVLLAPHHCSKKVMYVVEDGAETLKQDILDAFERHGSAESVVVVSSNPFPPANKPGDNPPHLIARDRYEEVCSAVVCTGEYPDADAPVPAVFVVGAGGLELLEADEVATEAAMAKSMALAAGAAVGVGLLARLAGRRFARRARPEQVRLTGVDRVRQAVRDDRGQEAAPQQPVGFGSQ